MVDKTTRDTILSVQVFMGVKVLADVAPIAVWPVLLNELYGGNIAKAATAAVTMSSACGVIGPTRGSAVQFQIPTAQLSSQLALHPSGFHNDHYQRVGKRSQNCLDFIVCGPPVASTELLVNPMFGKLTDRFGRKIFCARRPNCNLQLLRIQWRIESKAGTQITQ